MENEKKGFWASLFGAKKQSCCCGTDMVEMVVEKDEEKPCCCGGEPCKAKEVKVLGPGCAKCKSTYSVVEKVVRENGLSVQLTKVEDIAEIMTYNIMTSPAIVVDGEVKIKGRVPTEAEVKALLGV